MKKLTVVITGTHTGIGYNAAIKFLYEGHTVHGIDTNISSISAPSGCIYDYHHHIADVADASSLPDIENVDILINNAGVQNSGRDIEVNLKGVINCTEKYGMQPTIKSILNLASVSAHNGAEFPEYCASKGGVLAYTVNTAKRLAPQRATCNSLSFGGVITQLNAPVINDPEKWAAIMDETPMRKWTSCDECADWIYFFTTVNQSCTGQDLIIDNGEMINHRFIW